MSVSLEYVITITMIKPNLSQRIPIHGCMNDQFMKRLDQGHHHVSAGNRTLASVVASEHSSKELSEQRVNSYTEQLYVSARPAENARDISIFYVGSPLCGIRVRRGTGGALPSRSHEDNKRVLDE